MTEAKLRLLLLSAGSLVAQNVIDALGSRRAQCVLIGTNSVAEAAGSFRCDTAYLVPPAASGAAYIERVRELIQAEQPDLVIPTRDDDVLALAVLGEQSPPTRAVLLTGSVAAARMLNDKAETARFAGRHGLPFAPTAENAREALEFAKTYRLPLIGKPRSGTASRGVVLLRSTEEINRAFESRPDLIAQPYLDPPSNMDALIAPFEAGLPFYFSFPAAVQHTVQVLVGPDGTVSKPFGWLATFVAGHAVQNKRSDDAELLEVGRAYARAAAAEGWKGPLNVQLKRTRDGLVAFELNGRFGGGTAAGALMGFDDIGDCVARFLPGTAFPALLESEADAVQKYLRSYPVPRRGPIALRTAGTWSADAGNAAPKSLPQTATAKLRLLLLSVGSLVAQRLIDALGARRDRCILIGTNSVAEAAGNFRCDTVYLVPPAASGAAYIERIAELIREEEPDLVIPGRDDDILALSLLGEQSPPSKAVLLAGSVAAARIFNDKVESARFAVRHSLPFAATATDVDGALQLAKAHGLPLLGKPRAGNGGRGVVLLRSIAEIQRAFRLSPELIAQPFLDPPSNMDALIAPFEAGLPLFFSFPETRQYIVQIVVGPDGAISTPFGCIGTMVSGQNIQYARCDDPDLLELCQKYARAAVAEGWKGPLNVQFKRTSADALVAHEVNARFTGGTAARVYLGFDEIAEVTSMFLPKANFPAISATGSDVVQRYLQSHPLPREGVAALRMSGTWSRAN